MESILSIRPGLRMSGHRKNRGWIIFSGACAPIVGAIIVFGWPEAAAWTLSMLLEVNF